MIDVSIRCFMSQFGSHFARLPRISVMPEPFNSYLSWIMCTHGNVVYYLEFSPLEFIKI